MRNAHNGVKDFVWLHYNLQMEGNHVICGTLGLAMNSVDKCHQRVPTHDFHFGIIHMQVSPVVFSSSKICAILKPSVL